MRFFSLSPPLPHQIDPVLVVFNISSVPTRLFEKFFYTARSVNQHRNKKFISAVNIKAAKHTQKCLWKHVYSGWNLCFWSCFYFEVKGFCSPGRKV